MPPQLPRRGSSLDEHSWRNGSQMRHLYACLYTRTVASRLARTAKQAGLGDDFRLAASRRCGTSTRCGIASCPCAFGDTNFPRRVGLSPVSQVDRATDGRGRSGVVDLAIDPRLASADAAPGIDRQAAPGHDSRRTGSCPRCSPPWARSIPCSDRQECPACSFLFPLRRRASTDAPLAPWPYHSSPSRDREKAWQSRYGPSVFHPQCMYAALR